MHEEITQADQVFPLKTKLSGMGVLTENDLAFEVDCPELEERLLNNRFYELDSQGIPDESSEDYPFYLMQVHIDDQTFEIDPQEIIHHPIYEFYKELQRHFLNPKVMFDRGIIFTATLY